ncbi:hypothetical protein XELAEV_18031531mg [Xenopus laevis]|uniref:Uncharacterized protein n=1 Tax=Xenopus laevis TaxID=8355 RepID=A0A974CNZ1_XENLA|nr:hypothetical protein XELAEV_18031531mg [Xenopus laevis]
MWERPHRIKQHKSNVRCGYTHLPIPAHFAAARHTVSQLRYQVIDSVEPLRRGGDRTLQLKKLEMKWIQKSRDAGPRWFEPGVHTNAIYLIK